MSLTITIDRTENGHFRAEVDTQPGVVIEGPELSRWLDELKQKLAELLILQAEADKAEAATMTEVERTALRNEELDELIDRYPVPAEWGKEPGWSDAL